MNQQQVKYTIARVEAIEKAKIADLRKTCVIPAKFISAEERAALVRSGKVKLRADVTQIHGYTDVTDVFDFSKYAWSESVSDEFQPREAQIKAEAGRIRDEIMLGDQQAALVLLRAFEA